MDVNIFCNKTLIGKGKFIFYEKVKEALIEAWAFIALNMVFSFTVIRLSFVVIPRIR